MPEKGFLLLSDITGFTAYLSQTELDHAQGILGDLLRAIIAETKPPLVLSKLEGDAVFSYAADKTYTQSQSLLEIVERTYIAFRTTRRQIELETTCTCTACSSIPTLDLKFFAHHGEYMLQEFGTMVELVGSDVNLAHRLMKNSVIEATGLKAYAMYTEAAIEAMSGEDLTAGMIPHSETYEHLGQVNTFVANMEDVWQKKLDAIQVIVEESESLWEESNTVPYPRVLVWEFITRPETRTEFYGADSQTVTDTTRGRIESGATYHCAHGEAWTTHRILDWKPFDYYTYDTSASPGQVARVMVRLDEDASGGTSVAMQYGKVRAPAGRLEEVTEFYTTETRSVVKAGLASLGGRIQAAIDAGKLVVAGEAEVSDDSVDAAVNEVLKQEA